MTDKIDCIKGGVFNSSISAIGVVSLAVATDGSTLILEFSSSLGNLSLFYSSSKSSCLLRDSMFKGSVTTSFYTASSLYSSHSGSSAYTCEKVNGYWFSFSYSLKFGDSRMLLTIYTEHRTFQCVYSKIPENIWFKTSPLNM